MWHLPSKAGRICALAPGLVNVLSHESSEEGIDLWPIECGARERISSLCSPGRTMIEVETASNARSGELNLEARARNGSVHGGGGVMCETLG